MKGHEKGLNQIAFSPDGSLILTASDDGTVRLWDGVTGVADGLVVHLDTPVLHAEFSSDGSLISTASSDGIVRIWRVDGRNEIATFPRYPQAAAFASFSPEGNVIVTASADGTARLSPIFRQTSDLIVQGRAVLPQPSEMPGEQQLASTVRSMVVVRPCLKDSQQ
jgi:WD40 repeat protein